MDKIFNDLFNPVAMAVEDLLDYSCDTTKQLRAYVDETDEEYNIEVEVPGIKEEALKVDFKNGFVKIEAKYVKRPNSIREGKHDWSCKFPQVNADKITADLKDGLLTVVLPKLVESKPKTIKINS